MAHMYVDVIFDPIWNLTNTDNCGDAAQALEGFEWPNMPDLW